MTQATSGEDPDSGFSKTKGKIKFKDNRNQQINDRALFYTYDKQMNKCADRHDYKGKWKFCKDKIMLFDLAEKNRLGVPD